MIIGYIRVSTKMQVDGNSLEQQREEILNRYDCAIIKEEVYSGAKERAIFNAVLEELSDSDTLVVMKNKSVKTYFFE